MSERYLKRRYEEGKEEGLREGLKEGTALTSKEWKEWNQRRLRAEAAGKAFNESPPSYRNGK